MYFFSRYNLIYTLFAPIGSLYRYIFTIGALALLLFVWFFGVYQFIQMKLEKYQQQSNYLRQQLLKTQQAEVTTPKLEKIVQAMAKALTSNTGNNITELVLDTLSNVGLKLLAYNAGTSISCDWYSQQKITFESQGSLKSSAQFFAALVHLNMFLAIDLMSLTLTNNNLYNLCITASVIQTTPLTAK